MTAAAGMEGKAWAPSPAVQVLQEFWHYFRENHGAVVGLFAIVTIVLVAFLADLIDFSGTPGWRATWPTDSSGMVSTSSAFPSR